jgi:VanZ family protein
MKRYITKLDHVAIKYNLYLFLSIIFAIFILLGSTTPEVGGEVVKNSGIPAHFVSYFILSFSILLFLSGKKFQKPYLKAALLSGSYGLFIEFIQVFLTYRNFEIFDILINFAGAFLIFIIYLIKK